MKANNKNPILSAMAGWDITKEDNMEGLIEELKNMRTIDNVDKIDLICKGLETFMTATKSALDKGRTPIGYAESRACLRRMYELIGGEVYDDL